MELSKFSIDLWEIKFSSTDTYDIQLILEQNSRQNIFSFEMVFVSSAFSL